MAQGPFASVIIPTRGRPRMLRRALESLLRQSLPSWEAIVVDDGDGDGIEAAMSIGDQRITAVANAGSGQVDARTSAIERARGNLICWLDDDDWWDDPHHLSLLRHGASDQRAFFFRGGWIVTNDDGGQKQHEVFDLDATAESLLRNNTILTSSLAYPRATHASVGPLDRSLAGYCDWDLMLRMCEAQLPPQKLPGLGICYTVHGDNVSSNVDAPDRLAAFERFAAKHHLDVVISNHVRIHRLLSSP